MPVAAPLSTQGRWIVDSKGRRFKLAGVNWPAHYDPQVPDLLDRAPLDGIADLVASWANTVRLTFAAPTVTGTSRAPAAALAANPALAGLTPWQVITATARALTARGVAVILNCHLLWPGGCCSAEDASGLWWNSAHPEAEFTAMWQAVARTFAGDPLVVGFDIKNEPRVTADGPRTYTPTWDDHPQTGFAGMYTRVGNAIHAIAPDKLIICEGLSYAGDLSGVAARPVILDRPGKVVYSVHDYGFWYKPPPAREAYLARLHARAGYVTDPGRPFTAPLWLGEFGMENSSPAALGGERGAGSPDTGQAWWWQAVTAWLRQGDYDWCWWTLSGYRPRVTEPRTNKLLNVHGDRESYGLTAQCGRHWASPDLIAALRALARPSQGPA